MFIVPKKKKGIEKGVFVVLKRSVRDRCNVNVDLEENRDLYIPKYMELMYVVDNDFMKLGVEDGFAECIPVVFDVRYRWQYQKIKDVTKRKKTYLFETKNLQPILSNIEGYINTRMEDGNIVNMEHGIRELNFKYKDKLESANVEPMDLDKWKAGN